MKKIYTYAYKWRKHIIIATFCMILSSLFGLLPYFSLNEILIHLVNRFEVDFTFIFTASLIIFIGYLGKAIFTSIGMSLSHKAAFGVLLNIRKKYASNMIEHPMGQITKNGVGRYKKGFVEDVELIETSLAHLIPEGIPYIITTILLYVLIFITDLRLGFASLVVIPLSLIPLSIMTISGGKKMPVYFKSVDNLNSTIIEYISGMEVVKVFNKTTKAFSKYEKAVTDTRDFTFDWYKSSWKSSALLYSILPTTLILSLPLGFHFYNNGSLSFSDFTLILILNIALADPLIKLVEFTPNIPQVQFAFNKLEETFASEILQTGSIEKFPDDFDIKIDNISFAYENENIFDNFSLNIKEGEQVALVGESGSGKSTLAKLLMHFWDVTGGSISIGGIDIREFSSKNLMNIVSYVSQDTFLFSGTIMENLLMGRENLSTDEVIETCKKASCHDFIMKLEKGYFTEVGNLGKKLSGGERQRLSIVRAILKNAPIVVLDEATSHTDAENEKNIQASLDVLLKGKTVIMIAHRIDLISKSDKIVVLSKGKIDAIGRHEDVLQRSTIYKNLYTRNISALNWNIKNKEDEE